MTDVPLPQRLATMDGDRFRRYADCLAFYQGRQWDGATAPRDSRLTVNYARAFLDKCTSYLLAEASLAIEPTDAAHAALARRAEQALYLVHDQNNLAQLDFDTELDTAVLGDGCYKVFWDAGRDQVRVTAPDVGGLFVWWQPDDFASVVRVAHRYQLPAAAAARLHPLVNGRPEIEVVEDWTDQRFELWLDGALVRSEPNPYGFVPYLVFPNIRQPRQFWGVSDIEAFRSPAQELNRAVSVLRRILELSGNPIAVLENVDRAEDIAVAPGAVWELPEQARAYLLDLLAGGGVRLHVEYIDLLYRALHDLSETPRTSFGENRQGLSGVALEMELQPLLQKVKRKRLIRSWVYRRRAELALALLARFAPGRLGLDRPQLEPLPLRVRPGWGPVLPQDRGRLVDDELRLVEAGLHARTTAMDNLGVEDAEGELARVLAETALAGVAGPQPAGRGR